MDPLAASRAFASSAYRVGSARARSRALSAQPLGPTPFPVGGVSPEAVALKVAHSILDAGAMRERRAMADEQARRQMLLSEYQLQRARELADPGYMTDYQRRTLERLEAPKQAAPRSLVTLTRPVLGHAAGEQIDPAQLSAEIRIAEAGRAGQGRSRVAAANAGLRAVDFEQRRRHDIALAGFNQYLSTVVGALSSRDKRVKAEARSILGLPPDWGSARKGDAGWQDEQKLLATALTNLRGAFSGRLLGRISPALEAKREPFRRALDIEGAVGPEEAPVGTEETQPEEQPSEEERFMDAFYRWGGRP